MAPARARSPIRSPKSARGHFAAPMEVSRRRSVKRGGRGNGRKEVPMTDRLARRGAAAVLAILGLTLLLLAPSAGFAKPKPKPPPLPQEQVPLWDENAGEGVCDAVCLVPAAVPRGEGHAQRRIDPLQVPQRQAGDDRCPEREVPGGRRAARRAQGPFRAEAHQDRPAARHRPRHGRRRCAPSSSPASFRSPSASGSWRPTSRTRASTTPTRIRTAARTRSPTRPCATRA